MAWSPLSIIDAIDGSPVIKHARERQQDELPVARAIGTGAKGGGDEDSIADAIKHGLILAIGVVVIFMVAALAIYGG